MNNKINRRKLNIVPGTRYQSDYKHNKIIAVQDPFSFNANDMVITKPMIPQNTKIHFI